MNLLPFFQWCEATALGRTMRESIVGVRGDRVGSPARAGDDRRRGAARRPAPARIGLRRDRSPSSRARRSRFSRRPDRARHPGVALFASEAVKCYYSTAFCGEDGGAAVRDALRLHGPPRVAFADEGRFSDGTRTLVALVSLVLWFARRRRRTLDRLLGLGQDE